MRTISLLNMTFVVIGSCESLRRGEIKIATQEKSSSVSKEACLDTEHRILARKRIDDLRINLALPQKERRATRACWLQVFRVQAKACTLNTCCPGEHFY